MPARGEMVQPAFVFSRRTGGLESDCELTRLVMLSGTWNKLKAAHRISWGTDPKAFARSRNTMWRFFLLSSLDLVPEDVCLFQTSWEALLSALLCWWGHCSVRMLRFFGPQHQKNISLHLQKTDLDPTLLLVKEVFDYFVWVPVKAGPCLLFFSISLNLARNTSSPFLSSLSAFLHIFFLSVYSSQDFLVLFIHLLMHAKMLKVCVAADWTAWTLFMHIETRLLLTIPYYFWSPYWFIPCS